MRVIVFVVWFFLFFWLVGFLVFGSSYEYEHYTLKVGILQGSNNVNFPNDIVLLGFDTNLRFFDGFFGSVRFLLSFPDSRYSFFLFEPAFFYTSELFSFGKVVGGRWFFEAGIQNQSEFVAGVSNTNISSFVYYYFFIPFFRISFMAIFLDLFDVSLWWFGGYPIVFLPNRRPDWGLPVGYPSVELGIRGIVFDRVSFLYNPVYYSLNFAKRF